MNNEWKKLISDLYRRVTEEKMTDAQIAIEYSRLWWHETIYDGDGDKRFRNHIDNNLKKNVALLNKYEDKYEIARKTLLLADTSVLWETGIIDKEHKHDYQLYSCKTKDPTGFIYQTSYDYSTYLQINNINALGRFLRNNKELIEKGYLIYIPDIMVDGLCKNALWEDYDFIDYPSREVCEKLLDERSNTSCITSRNRFLEDIYIRSIAQVEIPYIDDCTNDSLIKAMENYSDEFSKFRLYLESEFLSLYEANGSESFDTNIKKIGINIKNGINLLNSDIKRINRHLVIKMGSFLTLGFAVATLVAINGSLFNSPNLERIISYLGTGGGIVSIANFVEQCLDEKQIIKEQPFYFIWLIHKK